MAGPLHGVRVLDLTTVVLGPYCTQIMADMGADVIKVESPDGDSTRHIGAARRPGMSGIFINLNRGKRSLVLDLKAAEGRAALLAVARGCDVFSLAQRAGLADDPRLASFVERTGHVDFAYELVESIIATRTSAEWIDLLEDADIPVMPVLSTDQLFLDPHLDEARMIDALTTAADGDLRLPRTPIELSETPAGRLTAAPELGQHSRQILVEAGYAAADADALVARIATGFPGPPGTS